MSYELRLVRSKKYLANTAGDIYSTRGGNLKRIKPLDQKSSYLFFHAYFEGVRKKVYFHRFVWCYFNGPIRGRVVNHKDFNKYNNSKANLEAISRSKNVLHAIAGKRFVPFKKRGT